MSNAIWPEIYREYIDLFTTIFQLMSCDGPQHYNERTLGEHTHDGRVSSAINQFGDFEHTAIHIIYLLMFACQVGGRLCVSCSQRIE